MIVLFWYLVRLLLTAFRKPKPSGGSHAITFGTSTRAGDSLTTLTMKSSNHSDTESKDYRGGSSSTVGQEDLIPIFLRRLNDLNIRVGTRTRFLIELDDATGVQVRWYHNNTEANSERYQYIHEGGFYCLDIVPVTLFDEGLWVCTAQNYAGKSSTAAHLSLTVPKAFKKPIFVEQLKAVLTQRGIVSLECKVIGVPTPKLRWYKDDKEIKAGDIFALTANSEEDCLGIYTCEATNVMGTALSTSKIQVTHTPLDGNRDADSLIPYGPPPKFVKFLKDASGKVGSVLFLECQVEVPPWPRSIGWYNNNGIVNEGPLYHLMADGLGMYGLEIKSLRADHSTTWKCIATSSTGAKAVTSCVVSVSYPKNYRVPRFLESLRAIMTDEGLVSFECKVIGYPTPQLSWFKDGKQLQPGDVYELTGSKSLGSYCCVARNCMGETSSIAELTIEDIQNQLNESEKLQLTSNTQPPRFLLGLKSIEANINESFVFTIKVTTESAPSISWYKEDEQLTESNRYQFSSEDNGTYMLSILPLEIDDQAEWKCVAINKYGQTVTSSFLKLNIPKTFKSPKFLEELRIAFSNEGSVNLECKVIGVPQPQLKWFKDGQELNPGDMHKIISGQSGTCCLGTYTCQAHNCMGTVSSSATLLTMEDKSTVKSCASEEYLSVGNPLVRNESLSTIPEERTSQMEKSYTIEEPADISFSFDGKEVTVSLYETPDLTHDEALQIIEMYADELSEHISEDNVVDLPSLRIVKESSISGPVMMEALVIDVPIDFCRQQILSDTEIDGVSLTEDITLGNNDKSDSICENSLEYFSDHLSSGNSKREIFYSASETTPKNSSMVVKQQSENDGHQSFQTPKLFMSDSDDQILTQLKLDERISPNNSRHVIGPLARSESNNTEEEVSETLAEIENEPPLSHNYCASEIVTQSDEDGLYSTVLNKIRDKGMASVVLSSEEDDVLKIISRPNVDEFLKYMKIILEGSIVKMNTHEHFNFTSTTTELERSIQALHSLAWKFIEETERHDVTELDKNTADNVSSLMTAINASLLALEQIDDPFGVSDNVLNEIQSLVCFDLETLNNSDLSASVILDRLSDQIKNFTIVVNKQVTRVTEQRIIAVLRNTIGTTLVYIKTLQQNCSKIKCVDINSLAPLFSMVQPLETILNDIAILEEASIDDNKPHLKLKQVLIPPISSIAFSLDSLSKALKSDSSNDDQDLKDIYDRISDSNNQFMILASQGMDSNKIAECFISFTKPINDLCCHLRRLGRSTENIVSSDYGSDDKLLLDFETLFDELMIDIDTLINNVNFVQDSENNMNPLGSLLEPLQDMKIGLFQVNQVLLSNQTGSTMSYEVMSCFEHLSQQLVQLNNCIANQSIVEETDKEIPFETSIKMMQNILFDDAIDDLGVNGILFGSVMKPLLQLQNLIVSKMASVESDLSFSEHTDVTGGACDTQSLSLSLSNNAQTIFNKTTDENSKKVIIESSIIGSSDKHCEKQNKLHIDNSETNKDSISFENNVHNDLVIKRGFECDIGDTFKDEEPNIITSEDDRDNSGFEALFDETDLETISDFAEDGCMDNIINSKVDQKLSDLSVNDSEIVDKDIDNIIPEHVLESLEKNNQQELVLNSPVDLFDELQETLKHISEVAEDKLTEIYDLDTNTLNINELQKNNSKCSDLHNDNSNKFLNDSLDVTKINNSTIINSDKLTKQNIMELSEVNNEEMNQCNEIDLKTDQNETFKNKDMCISDQDTYKKEQVFEIGHDVNFIENVECLDSDKSISNNTIITVNEISDSNEVKMKEVDNTNNLETTINLLESTSGNVSQIVDVDVPDESTSSFKNEVLDSLLLKKSNSNESIKNIKIVSSEDMIDPKKLNESEKLNILSNDNDTANKDTLLIKEIEEPSIADNVSYDSVSQDTSAINEIDSIYNAGTDMNIQFSQTRIEEEFNMEKDNKLIPIDKSTNAIELNKVLVTSVEEKNDAKLETNLMIGNQDTSIVEEISNDIKQNDDKELINKINCDVEEKETPTTELASSIEPIGYINLMTDLEDDIIRDVTEKQNSGDKNLNSGTFEIDQNINFDKILHQDLQPNINTTSVSDNKQIVNNFTISENIANSTTELNVNQTEEYIQNLPNQFIDEIQNHKNESELINEETLENVQQERFTVQQNNIFLQQSNNELKADDDLNEQCETLSEIKENNEVEFIDSKKVLPTEIIYSEDVIDIKNVEQFVIDNSNRIDDLSITPSNVDNGVHMPVTEVPEVARLNVLDEQLVIVSLNAEKSEKNKKECDSTIENNDIIDNIEIQFKNGQTNDFENTGYLTLNEKEKSSEEKYSDNDITEISMNDNENSINTLNKSLDNLKQSNNIDNNNTNLLESTLINNKIITLENIQPTDQYKFEESHVEIQFKDNIDSRNENSTVLDDKDNIINNLENLESKNEIFYFPDEVIKNDEEKSWCEIQNIQNDGSNISPNIEQTTTLIHNNNEMISVSNTQPLDTVVIEFENIKEQNAIELNILESTNTAVLENTTDTVVITNRLTSEAEIASNDKNNLIYDVNKDKSITKDYIETHTTKLIDEKSNSVSNEDGLKNNSDILKAMNNFHTENNKEKILTNSQLSDESQVEVSLTENDCATIIVDLETTKINNEKKVDSCKTPVSENYITKQESPLLVNENTGNCKEIASLPNVCIEILNENNVNQQNKFNECQKDVILENSDILNTVSHEQSEITNTITNVEKSNRNEDDLEINKRSEQNHNKNETDKKEIPIVIDSCKSMENKEILVFNKNQSFRLCDTNIENVNENLKTDLEINREIIENNFVKPLAIKNNLEGIGNIKNDEIHMEDINILKNLETSANELETIIDNTPRVNSNDSKKLKENLTIETLPNVEDELNTLLETPKNEYLLINKEIGSKLIESSNIDLSVNESLQIDTDTDIIAEHNNTFATEEQNMSVDSTEKVNVMTEDHPDKNLSDKSNSGLIEVQGNEESNTINENEENEHSIIKLESINIDEDKLTNVVEINDKIDIMTAVENNSNLLNDSMVEDGITYLSNGESLNSLSITPKLHYTEKIAANQSECVMLEDTNILKQNEPNATENVDQYAQVEHELNIAAIGNIIIDYDSVKEHSVTTDNEKKCVENATIAVILDDHSFKIVSTNVDVIEAPITDTIIRNEHTVTNEQLENSIKGTTLLCENKNSNILTVDDVTENSDNVVTENVQCEIGSMNKPTEMLNEDIDKQGNLVLKQDQNEEVVDKLQQSLKKSNKICESLVLSKDENDTTEEVQSDVGSKKKKSSLQSEDKKSLSPDKTKNTTSISEKEIDKTTNIDISIEEKNKNLSDENNDIKKAEVKLSKLEPEIASANNRITEEIIEKDVSTDDKNKNKTNNETDNNDKKLNDKEVELDKTKRGSKKKKSSLSSEHKKSPSPDKTKNIHISIEEKNKKLSDENNDNKKAEVKMSKLEPEITSENDKTTEEIVEKIVSTDDKNKNKTNNETDNNEEKLNDNKEELDRTKRGSKKKKPNLSSEHKKSPSPDKTKSNTSVTEKEIDKTKNIDISIEEKNKKISDENNDNKKAEVKMSELEPEITSENDKTTEKIAEKVVSTDDKNKNKTNNETDNKEEKLNDSKEELDRTKRGSKKKKSSLSSEHKKSPSPDKTKNITSVSEKEIDKTKNIDINIEEKNKKLSDENNDNKKTEVKMSQLEPEIALDNDRSTEEIIEKDISTDDKNKNQKNDKIVRNDTEFTESEIELNKTKRGSKKKKPNLSSEHKKSPSPDKTKSNTSVTEKEIDKTKNIDISIEEKNKKISDENNDNKKAEVKMSELEPEITSENDKTTEKIAEKVVSTDDKNKNKTNNETDNNEEKLNDNKEELDKTKRGSKKKKSSLQSEDRKSLSPDKTKINTSVSEKEIDKSKNIDINIEEKNKKLSDENNDNKKAEVKMSKLEPEITSENDKTTKEIIEKVVSTDDKNKNKTNNETDNNEEKLNDNKEELDKTKRGSKKKKPNLSSEHKKSPSPDKTKINTSVSEKEIDKSKNIDINIEEKNKNLSNDNNDTKKLETKLESVVSVEDIKNNTEKSENNISIKDTKQENDKLFSNEKELMEKNEESDEKNRGSNEKNERTESEKNKKLSIEYDNKSIEKEEIKLDKSGSEIALDINKNKENIIEKDVSTENLNASQEDYEIAIENNKKTTENNIEKDKIKRGSKINKSSSLSNIKKSPSPEDTKNSLSINDKTAESTKISDYSFEEKNQKLSEHYNDTENLEIKLDEFEPKMSSENNKNKIEMIEKDISVNDKNKNQKNNDIDTDDKKLLEYGNDKKNKISPEPEIKKLSSPDTSNNNINVIENEIDAKIIDGTIEDNNIQISEDNKDTEQVETKFKLKTAEDNNTNTTKKIEKDVSNNTPIKNQNNDDIGKDDEIKPTENCVEINSTKRESKRNKRSPQLNGKKSTSTSQNITEHITIQSLDENDSIIELEQLEDKSDESKFLEEFIQTPEHKEVTPLAFQELSTNNYKSTDCCQSEIFRVDTTWKGMDRKQTDETRSFVDVLIDEEEHRVAKNCFTTNKRELKSSGLIELNDISVSEVPSLSKRPVNRHLLDVTDPHKLRPNTLAYRSVTPDPLSTYRSLTPDHLTSYRSLTPDGPPYRTCLTTRSKYATSTRYAGSSDRELYGGSSSSRSSRSSSRSMSPYPSESRISARNLWPTGVEAYRCLSETSIPLSSRLLEEEKISGWPYTSYSVTTRRRRGSDSFLHDSAVRDGGYYSSWRLSNSRSSTYGATEDLCQTKEAFKDLYFCVRMIDQTVSSGARVKFWCSVIGYPEPRVQWYRDGQKLNSFTYNSSARYQTKYDGGLAQLIIDNAQSGDSGEYTCVAANSRDRISTTGFLTVYTSPSVFRKPLLQPSLSVDNIEYSRGAYSRTSHDFRLPANAKFDFGSRRFGSDLVSRRPEYPKFVSSIIADDVATCGGTIALQVRVQGSPVPNVTWMRESRPLPRLSGKYVYLDEGGLYTLLIMDSTARDGGTYVCRSCNLYGVADAEKAVRVVSPHDYTDRRGVKPAIIVSRPNDRLNVAIGEDITVTLRVAGEPKPKVIWMRGSRDVTFFDRSSKETVNDYVMLSIKKAQPSDAGTYFIIAKNVYGSDRAFVTVGVRKRARSLTPPQIRNTIGRWLRPIDSRGGRGGCANNEVPGPVRSEPAVTDRTNNRISLQWDRPEKPETVLVYRVEARSADEECWRQVGMTPTNTIDVYNLKPGYRYQFRVAARNRFGWSQPVAAKGYVDVFEPKCLPEFCQPLPGQSRVLLRHSATLQCHVRGVPEPRVSWFKDGEPLLSSERHAIRRTNAGKCTLTIADVSDGDEGRYSCEAVNDQGRVCTLTVVQVIANRRIVEAERRLQGCLMKNNNFKESAPLFTKHLIDRRVEINSTVRLSCQVNGLPVPLVLWYKDGQPIDFSGGTDGDRKSIFRDDSDDFYTLELTGVKYDDSGAYAAVASNAIGKASTQCVLEVFNKNRTDPAVPMFVFGLPTTIEAVDSIILSAQIDAYRPVKVQWFRDGIQLRNGRRVDIITDHDGKLELRIACVTTRDSGTYMLRVSNDTGTVESRCEVNVVEREHNDTGMEQISLINHLYSKKPKFVVKPKFQEVEEGQEVIIDSEIVGDPLPKITWLRDGLKPEYYRDNSEFLCISNGNRYQLKIPHAKLTHTGTYTLLAANPHGQVKALISLQVYSTGHCKKKMENGTNHATVERLPRISRGLVDIECRENDSITFECKLNITQETDIRWQKDGKLVRLGKQIKSQLIDGDTARLEISTVSPLHEGLYTCTAYNELGQDSTSARLIFLSDSQNTAKVPQSNGQQNTMLGSPILAGESNDRCTKRLKRSSAPKFYAVLHDRIADVGETVRFQCSVSGHPPPWSSWEKDGQPIGVNSRMRIREDDDYRSLEICDVTSDDAGLYRITVENKFGKIQATARLEVLTHNQTTNDVQITSSSNGRRQSGSAACAGENFTLSCDIRGNSMSDVTWYKNDVEVKPDDRVTSSLDDLAARLSISNLESADTGVYTCVARCDSGVTRCSTELCVFDTKPGTDSYLQPPIFVEGLVPKRTADEGEPVQLTVRLQGAVPMNASWFKNDVLLPDCVDFEYVVAEDRGEFGLSIIDPFVKDSGVYSCKVANSFGQAVSSGQLVINEMSCGNELNNNLHDVGKKITCDTPVNNKVPLPASILSGPSDTTVLRGAKVVLKTSYQGDPEPCVQWLRAGKVLESDAHVCITNERGVSCLTIDSITADDCGKYVVRVDNGHGNDFHFASVAVEGPPDPPAGRPVVSVLETSADVTWSSPAYDGGCMVTGYGVEVRPFNQSDWKLVADKCHSLSHIVRGLAPGESYVFRVRAENMHGSSEASLESTPVYILQTDYGNTLWPKTVNIENGDLFDKQYEMLDELGKGRYGVVYKVKERETNKYYAAKFVRCIKSTDKEKAQEEVDIMNCLRHPKLLQLDAAFDKPREVVLVTEYISGGELFERVVADDFTLTEKDCILFMRQICEGVDYMHKQNVVHLDLKPENIMCQSRTSHYIKLIDFGLAQKIIPGQPMRVLFGTPEFIPPEIIGYEPIGFESDMWSVGVICYVLLSGLSPFMGDNDSETFTNITKAEFDFDDEAFDAVSQDAKDFISALLIKRKELRLTAKECLKHKWLAQQDMDMSCVILSTDKLKKFIIRRKWQKTGNAIRALGRMAILSAASRRSGGGGGAEPTDGNGTRCILQKLKMASLKEEDSIGESPSEEQKMTTTETTKSGSGHKACDDRSDSGFSECPSVASPTAMLVRPPECPSAVSEETPLASNRDHSPPPPTRRSTPPITDRSSTPATIHSSSPTTIRSSSPATIRPSSPTTTRHFSPAIIRSSSPVTKRSSSPATIRASSPATIRPSSPATMRRSSPATIRPSSPATIRRSSPATIRLLLLLLVVRFLQ
ncbi:uncharacterized protein LOC114128407 isoform X2 [Aphis gossypii]|uniref:uncharacterized protein LOC114128407 isoform X2 n=1 Tax=Aphis gossypii TaxID=80765 RepID=UPI0021596F25|nr:uncharacterized protein LOC114128407 isoform X2 [Aphis gossypii]